MPSQQQISTTPPAKRDSWQTPQWLFDWADSRYGFTVDLAASMENKKCHSFVSIDNDSLNQDWSTLTQHHGGYLWLNPPYSNTGSWLKKAWEDAQEGCRVVMLIPAPNGDSYWQKYVFGKASEIIFINGRVAFELPGTDGKPIPQQGNTRGSCLVVFNRTYEGPTALSWANRDDMIKEYSNENAA